MTNVPPQRVSAIAAPDHYQLPMRPDDAPTAVQDAFRQTQFVLGTDLKVFAETMELQLQLLGDAAHSRYRTQELAALTALWSRAFVYMQDAMLLACRGSYVSAIPVVRTTAEVIAAQEGLRAGEIEEHQKWLLSALRPSESFKAVEFELGRYFAGEVLAADPVLRSVYRAASDLGRPNFGATLLQVGPESNNARLAIAFADTSFHLAWAELVIGWLIALSVRQVKVIVDAGRWFPVSDERRTQYAELSSRTDELLRSVERCFIETVEADSDRRYLVHNFRRSTGASPKKILL